MVYYTNSNLKHLLFGICIINDPVDIPYNERGKIMKKTLAYVVAIGMILFSLTACAAPQPAIKAQPSAEAPIEEATASQLGEQPQESGKLSFSCFVDSFENQYAAALAEELESLLQEAGGALTLYSCDKDAGLQAQQVEEVAAEGTDCVVIVPAFDDTDDIPGVEAAVAAGIPVFVVVPETREALQDGAYVAEEDQTGMGRACAEMLMEDLPDGGQVAVMGFPEPLVQARAEGFMAALGDPFEVVAGETIPEDGANVWEGEVLAEHPDIAAFFYADSNLPEAIDPQADIFSDRFLYIANANKAEMEQLLEGAYAGVSPARPREVARQLYGAARELLAGNSIDKKIEVRALQVRSGDSPDFMETEWLSA